MATELFAASKSSCPGISGPLQRLFSFLFRIRERLLDMIHNFVVFDAGTKKLCRPNQYFGVKESQKYISRNNSGNAN
jgi:type I restriction enzyme R subunit